MILVDTSSWIEQLRPHGNPDVCKRVESLLRMGDAAWCPIVRLELWNGAKGAHERKVLSEMEKRLPVLDIDSKVWARACELARNSRLAGLAVPSQDILVFACGRHHGVGLEHADSHFEMLSKLEVEL